MLLERFINILSYLLTVAAHRPKYQIVPSESPDDSTIASRLRTRETSESSDCRGVAGVEEVQSSAVGGPSDALS